MISFLWKPPFAFPKLQWVSKTLGGPASRLITLGRSSTDFFKVFFKAVRFEIIWYNAFNEEVLWIFHDSWTVLFPLLITIRLS